MAPGSQFHEKFCFFCHACHLIPVEPAAVPEMCRHTPAGGGPSVFRLILDSKACPSDTWIAHVLALHFSRLGHHDELLIKRACVNSDSTLIENLFSKLYTC